MRELVLVGEVHMRDVRTADSVDQTVTRRIMYTVVECTSLSSVNHRLRHVGSNMKQTIQST